MFWAVCICGASTNHRLLFLMPIFAGILVMLLCTVDVCSSSVIFYCKIKSYYHVFRSQKWPQSLQTSMCKKSQWFRAKELRRGQYEILSYARKMGMHEEKRTPHETYRQYLQGRPVTKFSKVFFSIKNATSVNTHTSFWAALFKRLVIKLFCWTQIVHTFTWYWGYYVTYQLRRGRAVVSH